MNHCDYISLDFETTGVKLHWHEACQVGAVAYDCRTLAPYPKEEGGEFDSLMRPLHFDRIDEGALRVNRLTRRQLEEAPEQGAVWAAFTEWTRRYSKKGVTGMPVLLGKNVRNFDLHFVHDLNELYGKKKGKTQLFHKVYSLDLQDLLFAWHEDDPEMTSLSMDAVRERYCLPTEGAHSAIVDARQTGDLIMRFLRLHRRLLRAKTADGRPMISLRGKKAENGKQGSED